MIGVEPTQNAPQAFALPLGYIHHISPFEARLTTVTMFHVKIYISTCGRVCDHSALAQSQLDRGFDIKFEVAQSAIIPENRLDAPERRFSQEYHIFECRFYHAILQGCPGWSRTNIISVNSRTLCRLSYWTMRVPIGSRTRTFSFAGKCASITL